MTGTEFGFVCLAICIVWLAWRVRKLEPTEAMMSAGADAVSTLFDPGAKAVWQAMVDAALEEGK